MADKPLVSIVVLNWNGAQFLEECIVSVMKTAYSPIEIIVVDNNSSDNSLEILQKYPAITIIQNDQNYGYAQGNNIGIARSHGTYVVTLNNDITVDPDWLDAPVEMLQSNRSIGLVCCRQMSSYDHTKIDGLYHIIKPDLTFFPFGHNHHLHENPLYLKPGYVISVNGGSSIIRKSMFEQVGGFDARFFAYFDETDLCMKTFLSGWRSYYSPESVVYHKGSLSFKKTGIFAYFLRERNRLWFLYKYFPMSIILRHLCPLLIMELRVIRVMCIKLRRPDQYVKCRMAAFSALPLYKETRKKNLLLLKERRNEFALLRKKGLLADEEAFEHR
jgi:GT2 family glycosyltransferase